MDLINILEVFTMVSVTLSVPTDLKEDMDEFREMNWSEVARDAIKKKVAMLKIMKEFTKNSTLTEKDALELGRKVNEGLAKRHGIK